MPSRAATALPRPEGIDDSPLDSRTRRHRRGRCPVAAGRRQRVPTHEVVRACRRVEFQDDKVHAVAIYDYSQRNHGGGWILIQTGIAVQPRTTIKRDNFQILMPGGRAVPLPTQQQFLADSARITQLRQNATIFNRNVRSYFPKSTFTDTLNSSPVGDRCETGRSRSRSRPSWSATSISSRRRCAGRRARTASCSTTRRRAPNCRFVSSNRQRVCRLPVSRLAGSILSGIATARPDSPYLACARHPRRLRAPDYGLREELYRVIFPEPAARSL